MPDLRILLRLPLLAAVSAMAISCSQIGNTLIHGSEAAAAKDQIMLVRPEPPSFGYQRLLTQMNLFPDLGFFVSRHGVPNFLAETGSQGRKYFILYYLQERKAFVCRNRVDNAAAVEFAGPYPVTEREYKLLDTFRKDPSSTPKKL
jgi:hypothetical protein